MNWLDIVLGIILLASIFSGAKDGFARTVLGTVATIVGLFLGLWCYGVVGNWLAGFLRSQEIANLLGFFVIFISVVIAGALLGALIDRLLKAAQLSWLNRLLGGAFGAVRGALIGAIVVLGIMTFSPKGPPSSVANSYLAPYTVGTARVLIAAAPRELKDAFQNSYERVKKIWSETLRDGIRKDPERTN